MAFDAYFMRYGDAKGNLRCLAVENMCLLARQPNSSYQSIVEKLISPVNFVSNKSPKVKEHIMYTILLFYRIYGPAVLGQQYMNMQTMLATGAGAGGGSSTGLISQLSLLLGDNVVSVRQVAIDLFANFHSSTGDAMLYQLEKRGIRGNIIEKIQESVVTNSCYGALDALGLSVDSLQTLLDSAASPSTSHTQSVSHTVCGGGGGSGSSRARSASDSLADTEDKTVTSSSNSSSSSRKRLSQTAPLSAAHKQYGHSGSGSGGHHSSSSNGVASPTGTGSSAFFGSTGSNTNAMISGKLVDIQECLFNPINYTNLLIEGDFPVGTRVYSEKDISRAFDRIQQGLSNQDDWNVRMQALGTLQSLVLGDAMEFETEFVHQCRSHIDTLVAQVR